MSDKKKIGAQELAERRKAAARAGRVSNLRIEATKAYQQATEGRLFTKDFNSRLAAFMRDPMCTAVESVYG